MNKDTENFTLTTLHKIMERCLREEVLKDEEALSYYRGFQDGYEALLTKVKEEYEVILKAGC